jgi:hypothetical protein
MRLHTMDITVLERIRERAEAIRAAAEGQNRNYTDDEVRELTALFDSFVSALTCSTPCRPPSASPSPARQPAPCPASSTAPPA